MQPVLGSTAVAVLAFAALVATSTPPRLNPDQEEHIYQSGSSFRLSCEATTPVDWKLPVLSRHFHLDYIPSTKIEEENIATALDGYTFRSVLIVTNATVLDTGYYTCYHKETNADAPKTAIKTYVYVEDEQQLIVGPKDTDVVTVVAQQSKPEVIPCKPTHPDVQLKLTVDNGEINLENDVWSYNPREGFTIHDLTSEMRGVYHCWAERKDVTEVIPIYVVVQPATSVAPKPHIRDDFPSIIALQDSFQLNCSASYDSDVIVDLKWVVPNPKGVDGQRIRIGNLSSYRAVIHNNEQQIAYRMLYVSNATAEDSGRYQCQTYDHTDKSESTEVEIKIHDVEVSYVNISNSGVQTYVEFERKAANETMKWVVAYSAYPDPKVIWSKDNREHIITNNAKFFIKTEQKRTTLEIKDAELEDSGEYFLTIKVKNAESTRNFTLRVLDKPKLLKPSPNLSEKHVKVDAKFRSDFAVIAYPASSIDLFFRSCASRKLCSNSNWTLLEQFSGRQTNKEQTKMTKVDFQTTQISLSGYAKTAGQYRCVACNKFGCIGNITSDDYVVQIFVNDLTSDNVNGTELLTSVKDTNPVAGETFNITCRTLLYTYSKRMTWWWTNSSGKTVKLTETVKPPGAMLKASQSNYSYAEALVWSSIAKAAAGIYTCQIANEMETGFFNTSTEIQVMTGTPPKIYNFSNAIAIEQFTDLMLFCDAYGLPTPEAQWLKDGSLVREGVENTSNGTKIYVRYANISHSGSYTCLFRNLNGTAQESIEVQIREQPIGTGYIIGIVLVIIFVVVLVTLFARRIYRDKKRKEFFRANQLDMFDKGNPESINPDLPIDEQTELLPYDKRWEFPRDRLKLGKQLGAGAFGRVVKAQAVGIDGSEPVTTVAVKMVRSHGNMIGLKALMSELKIMIHMGSHLNVVNVLGACTKNVTKGELFVIVEYCRYGNIQNYLIRNRSNFINQVDAKGYVDPTIGGDRLGSTETHRTSQPPRSPLGTFQDYNASPTGATEMTFLSMSPTGGEPSQQEMADGIDSSGHPTLTSNPSNTSGNQPYLPWRSNYRGDYRDLPEQPLCTRDIICWAFQIARGMEYLARRKIIHGDLAARNVLLADNNIVKIADFGLAREVYRSENYKKKGEGPLPVKWMAIESILDRVFSTQSDVWSFGIVLWELFSLGKTPYPGMEADEQFFLKLQQGYRMEKPKYSPVRTFEVMKDCWLNDPKERPDFTTLSERLGEQLEISVRRHYIDLNEVYVQSNNAKDSPDYLSMMSPVNYVNIGSQSSPMPPRYANLPPQYNEVNRTSDYLQMDGPSQQSSPIHQEGYLFMSCSDPKQSPLSPNSGLHNSNFDFQISPRLHKADANFANNSVELRPMLSRNVVAPIPVIGSENEPININGFSNPSYQNPPAVRTSDLDDLQLEQKTGVKTYENLSPTHVKEEEQHYVNPKNNTRV